MIIQKITISDFNQSAADTISAKIHLYISTRSMFGSIKSQIVIGASIKKVRHEVRTASYGSSFVEKRFMTDCLDFSIGDSIELAGFQSTLGQSTDRTIGLGVDFMLKLFSPMASMDDRICNYP